MIVRALGAFAIGAIAVYFFDPVSGKRRRDLLRNRLDPKELRNRARGIAAEARGMVERRQRPRRRAVSHVDIDLSQPQP